MAATLHRQTRPSFDMQLRQEEEDAFFKVIELNERGGLDLVRKVAAREPEDSPLRREYKRLLTQCVESNKDFWRRQHPVQKK